MLVFPHPIAAPPPFIRPFLELVQEHLSAPTWRVVLTAYDDEDPDDPAFISAAVVATTPTGLRAEISRHAGDDTVVVQLDDSDPIPIEDLAVAKGALDQDVLLAHAAGAPAPVGAGQLPPIEDALNLLSQWTPVLCHDLRDPETVARLRAIADGFIAAMGHGDD